MVDQAHLPDDEIAILLDQADVELPGQWAEHLSKCVICQQRVELLAAEKEAWSVAKTCLEQGELRNGDCSITSSLEELGLRQNCNESMIKQLLDAPKHPEMLGRLGRYEVERVIGTGGMGIVFRAHDTELHRPVAIKMLAPHLSGSGSARSRFAREARAAAAIVNDHVVPIHNVETDHTRPYLVMQYIAGDSLQARLDREGTLELSEILRIGMQVATGLAAAHAQGLIHRDVKPSNILLDENVARALLTDFGLARTQDDACLTRSGFHPGTPHYMSPEQVRGEELDGRSDLFGLGCVMYALCTGHPPFRAESGYAVMRRITDETPTSICEQNSVIPRWLERIVLRLLEKDKVDRIQSATEVADLLERCLAYVQKPNVNELPLLEDATPQADHSQRGRIRWQVIGSSGLLTLFVCWSIYRALGYFLPAPQENASASQNSTSQNSTSLATATATALEAEARQAMSTIQNRLVWTKKFRIEAICRYTHKEVGQVEDQSILAGDGTRLVHRHTSLKLDKPADFIGRSLTSFALFTGEAFMGGTCLADQPMKTGGYSKLNAEEHAWGMYERGCMKLEGYRAGNQGQTVLELLLKSKVLDVKKEQIGETECFRISNRDEWGTTVVWIEATGKNRLLQWESRKERGNKFSRSRHGEHRDTSNYESSGLRIINIQYQEIDGIPIAVRGTFVSFHTPNGGQEESSSAEIARKKIVLKPDFSTDSIFDPLFAEGARITDWDGSDPDKHYWWRNGQLVASIAQDKRSPNAAIDRNQAKDGRQIHIAGRCVDENDQAIENAVVELFENESKSIKSTKTDGGGNFDLGTFADPHLTADSEVNYTVIAHFPGKAIGYAVTLVSSNECDQLQITLGPPGQIKGTVVDNEGNPVKGARVNGSGIPLVEGMSSVITNDAGEYALNALPLLARSANFSRFLTIMHPDYGLVQRSFNECPTKLDITLDQPSTVAGRVIDDQGRPIAGMRVYAKPSRDQARRMGVARSASKGLSHAIAITNSEGKYSFKLQFAGPIDISLTSSTHLAKTLNDIVAVRGETVTVRDVTASLPAYVVGRVIDVETDNTVVCPEKVRLRVYAMGEGELRTIVVHPDGTYRLPVVPGKTFVYFSISTESLNELTKTWELLDHPNPLNSQDYPVEATMNKEVEVNLPLKLSKEKLGMDLQRFQGTWQIQAGTYVASGNARVRLKLESLLDGDRLPLRFTIRGNQWVGHSSNFCSTLESEMARSLCDGIALLAHSDDTSNERSTLTLMRFENGHEFPIECYYTLKGNQLELTGGTTFTRERLPKSRDALEECFVLVAERLPAKADD